ncbi:alpha/beta hydrolase [Pullulanibacillus sp. KACC 23026]|uniref:alpha/beta fold hydrolase n=1 Tax=Pullulanibacillus sp. KACC 23026 TaxID=3028315 RepID=UPI0023B07619|nr:alpha/beta hydrolase [Pullulanibacillus sp. KACC 23026]WEG13079.1 alpha/beta hydrolase [Pullulanibacillus sp. KACC 23026]
MPKFETTDGVKLFYESVGEGQPLIMIHPPLMGHVVFKNQKELAEHYRLIFLDLRGHGHSDRHVQNVSVPRLVEDLNELLTHLNLQKAAFLGYSAGGIICQAFASHYPEKVSALILSGGFLKVDSLLLDLEFRLGMALLRWKRRGLLSKIIAKSHSQNPREQQELFDYGTKNDPGVVEAMYRELKNYDGTQVAWHLENVPILLMYGSKSYLKRYSQQMKTQIDHAKLAYIDKGNHQLPTLFSGPFNKIIDQFLRNDTKAALQ